MTHLKRVIGVVISVAIGLTLTSAAAASANEPLVKSCAKKLIRPMVEARYSASADVEAALDRCLTVVKEPRIALGSLGSDLYRFEYCTPRPSVRGWFFFSQDDGCYLLAGDLPDLLQMPVSVEAAADFTVGVLNQLVSKRRVNLVSEDQALSYASAALALAAPMSEKKVLERAGDIWSAATGGEHRGRSLPKRVAAEITAPKMRRSSSGLTIITMYTWEDPGGLVKANEILLWPDGHFTLRERLLASRVGPYKHDVRIVM